MENKKYYVVVQSKLNQPALFLDEQDCKNALQGCEHAQFKVFTKLREATKYMTACPDELEEHTYHGPQQGVAVEVVNYAPGEITLAEAVKPYETEIMLFATGGYNPSAGTGSYCVHIKKGATKRRYQKNDVAVSTANRVVITGLLDAMNRIADKNESRVVIFVASSLGFKKSLKNEGPNIDLMRQLLDKISSKDLRVVVVELLGLGDELKRYQEQQLSS